MENRKTNKALQVNAVERMQIFILWFVSIIAFCSNGTKSQCVLYMLDHIGLRNELFQLFVSHTDTLYL